ncbi:hypothetical protein [Sphingomonas sp. RIT328]|uniref:hypothetical protein n=1 Tax=Sphingomonas sp. RIT328 TaxID=1470591 RepID=UPI000447DD77|nr:hypothetical protein [Sphingomonas sp. RIT328]EZP57265.1 hypothetical protein BW41_00108 [Sphingomonas sp. RIT328]
MAFTEADQKKLDDLTYRKASSEWATREDARKAKLAAVGALGDVFTKATVQPFVDAANAARPLLAASDPTIADMLGNIVTVMGFSGLQVAQFVEQLSVAEPEPTAPADAPATSSD